MKRRLGRTCELESVVGGGRFRKTFGKMEESDEMKRKKLLGVVFSF